MYSHIIEINEIDIIKSINWCNENIGQRSGNNWEIRGIGPQEYFPLSNYIYFNNQDDFNKFDSYIKGDK